MSARDVIFAAIVLALILFEGWGRWLERRWERKHKEQNR
jgi:hypothetical protein